MKRPEMTSDHTARRAKLKLVEASPPRNELILKRNAARKKGKDSVEAAAMEFGL